MTAKNLLESTNPGALYAAAVLCGMADVTPQFRLTLETLPADAAATVGEVARAYLRARLVELEATHAANQADIDRVITMRFTPLEKDCVLHRLEMWDCFEQVFADTDGMEHLASDAAERARELGRRLAESKDGALEINGTELDAEIIREAIEGSTWMGVVANELPALQARHWRSLTGAARKIEAALGLPENDINCPEA